MLTLASLMLVAAPAAVTAAPTLEELRESFKRRYPKLLAAQNEGKVGETWDGRVAGVKGQSLTEDQQKLVREENADRDALYRILAKQENTTPEKVATRNRERNFRTAKPEHYLQTRDGSWVQKKDLKDGGE